MSAVSKLSRTQLTTIIFDVLSQIAPEADFEDLDSNEDMRAALDIDSFDFLNFLIGLDEAVSVEIPEADYGQLNSLNNLLDYLQNQLP